MELSPISKDLEYLGGPGGRSRNFGNYWRSRGLEKSYFDIFTFNSDLDGLINHYIPEKGRLLIWLRQRGNRELQ